MGESLSTTSEYQKFEEGNCEVKLTALISTTYIQTIEHCIVLYFDVLRWIQNCNFNYFNRPVIGINCKIFILCNNWVGQSGRIIQLLDKLCVQFYTSFKNQLFFTFNS
jgi:hypothetical protein